MKAITVVPGRPGTARLDDVPEPDPVGGEVLVRTLGIGICGTDHEIVDGEYGWAPPGRERLVLGHESVGEVLEAPDGCGFAPGDVVAGIVRRPDPEPCVACAVGEWDMCRNGAYTERGIKELDGFCAERFRIPAAYLVKLTPALRDLGVLLEPASVLAKAWDQIERIGQRAVWEPRRVLVTGAGPIGLLAALLSVQRGFDTHVLDIVVEGPKPDLVRDLGATYHHGDVQEAGAGSDVVIECTGVGSLALDATLVAGPSGVVCLTGMASGGRHVSLDANALNRELVLENGVVFGTVNANRRHYEQAAAALVAADPAWLGRLVSRRVPLASWEDAFRRQEDDVKVVIDLSGEVR